MMAVGGERLAVKQKRTYRICLLQTANRQLSCGYSVVKQQKRSGYDWFLHETGVTAP
jgi:hypothetical protein